MSYIQFPQRISPTILLILLITIPLLVPILGCGKKEPASNTSTPSAMERMATGEGIHPETSSRLITKADLKSMTPFQLKIMKNEIFARHGFVFKSPEMVEYFSKQPWYKPDSNYSESSLSKTERENVALISSLEGSVMEDGSSKNAGTSEDRKAVLKTWGTRYAQSLGMEVAQYEYDLCDFDSDGDNDAVCNYTISGGGSGVSGYLAVFENQGEVLTYLAGTEAGNTGDWLISKFSKADNRRLFFQTTVWVNDDAMCCPSGKGAVAYAIRGSKLEQVR
ncbi:MAG: YARHG domain-containing protein [Bacteroidota bacterium]